MLMMCVTMYPELSTAEWIPVTPTTTASDSIPVWVLKETVVDVEVLSNATANTVG